MRAMDDVWGQEPFVSSDDASLEYTSTTAMSSQTLEDIVASFDLSSSSYANAETSSPSSCKLEHLAEQLVTCDLQHTTDGRGASSEQSHAMTYQPDQSAMPGCELFLWARIAIPRGTDHFQTTSTTLRSRRAHSIKRRIQPTHSRTLIGMLDSRKCSVSLTS